MSGAVAALLTDGRLHLQHGPIDVIVECWAAPHEVRAAYEQAQERFASILEELVRELPALRTPVGAAYPLLKGRVARRMVTAVWPFRAVFITPMAAVAGAVADELLQALLRGRTLAKACVNDGGDIALHLGAGESLRVAIVHDPARPACDAAVDIRAGLPVRGVATSGWRGRSHSLGIADAVTVLAANGAAADAAATLIANAVNIDHPGIERRPARSLREDSDLGEIPVTVHVPPLSRDAVRAALENGRREAEALHARGLVHAACLALQGETLAYPASLPLKLSSTSSAALSQGGSRP